MIFPAVTVPSYIDLSLNSWLLTLQDEIVLRFNKIACSQRQQGLFRARVSTI